MGLCGDIPKVVGIFLEDGKEKNQFVVFGDPRGPFFFHPSPLLLLATTSHSTPRIMQDPELGQK